MSSKQKTHLVKERNGKKEEPPQVQLDNLVKLFWGNNPYVKDVKKNNEKGLLFLEYYYFTLRNIRSLGGKWEGGHSTVEYSQ